MSTATKPRRIDGVDLSHHNPVTETTLRQAKAAGVRFLYHKATEGAGYVDPTYTARRALAKAIGLPFGAYHFARPAVADAAAEAQHFLKVAKPTKGDLAPALDLETTEGLTLAQLRTWAATWVDVVRKATGAEPVVYTPFDLGTKGLRWRPRYNDDNRPPTLAWDLWQFSNGQLGKPDTVAGLGRVDLNTFADGKGLTDVPRVGGTKAPAKPTRRLKVAHASMQFSDGDAAHTHDAGAVFSRGYDLISGTEAGAGAGNLTAALTAAAKANGYGIHFGHGDWVAWRRALGKRISTGYVPVILQSGQAAGDPAGHYAPKGIPWVRLKVEGIGLISFGASHFLTKGRTPGETQAGPLNHYDLNNKLAAAVGAWAKRHGAASGLALWGADTNRTDRYVDVLDGAPLTTCWDELGKYPPTLGRFTTMDVIASYDRDGRVRCHAARALDDTKVKLATDHYLIEAEYDVELLPATP